MSYPPPNQHHGHPTGAPPNMAANFNAMLQRSIQEPAPQDIISEVPGSQPASIGYGGVYSSTPPTQFAAPTLGRGRTPQPQQILPTELPPQAFLTSAMLLDMVDKKVDVLLRDEKEYIGILRSYDQFANLVLTECSERISARNPEASSEDLSIAKWLVCDVKLPGVMTIRGENVTICATVDLDREDTPRNVKFAPENEIRSLAAEQKSQRKTRDDRRFKALKAAGIEPGFGMQA
ncbi:hypothetical protein BU24DRAFT_420387 [Aaosphaeria arxii CBS 175.79]|uniref:Sm domain-containing protein n=1 Tax=Aaosphaeria arxii CBS 175.79 TaxID=1450172 RepID=A0A6A5XWR7_9PLEO|nr:uncharacterized protein BU24DRAFT_420387 [Aaosphaeria arxii CBS 175.79]KAF2017343.1 hypothetical protein BU24DRAFT_420387 [Aaosphaeria arxii CBS 175.79]